ncbi:MAG: hypothetical protein HYT80_05325 [Euryarchaeota archaeon]|nr:hypothetical protein [Euryarchaeota archaeon]
MKRGAGVLVVVALGLVLVSGCAVSPDGGNQGLGGEAEVGPDITDPANLTFAFDNRAHVHDYWAGEFEKRIFDADFTFQLPHVGSSCDSGANGKSCLPVRPDEGTMIIPGTRWINATVTWTSSDSAPGKTVYLGWSAADHRTSGQFPDVKSGSILSIPVNESLTDLPHARTTRWSFLLLLEGRAGAVSGHISLTIARPEGPLPLAPAHPHLWGFNRSLTALDESGRLCAGVCPSGGKMPRNQLRWTTPPIVPFDTERVRILFWFNSTTPSAGWFHPLLSWHGADRYGFERTDVAPQPGSPTALEWTIDVEPRMWDSPYASETSWGVRVSFEGQTGTLGNFPPSYMDGNYHLRVEFQRSTP